MDIHSTIYLVDDDPLFLNIYSKIIQQLGYENLHLFASGTECLDHLDKQPALVFLDHSMDDLTGFEVLNKIKRFNPNIFVVIISAQESIEVAVNALKYGAFDYIIKGENEVKRIANVLKRIELIEKELRQTKPTLIQRILSIF
jgi:DNA-binding NtrC family response regulator